MNKKKLKSKKSQSVVEFAIVFPVFLLCIFGIIQFAIIIMNCFFLQYSAYMVARVAVVYEQEERLSKAEMALAILKLFTYYSNSITGEKNVKDKMIDIAYDAAVDYGVSYVKGIFNETRVPLQINSITIEETRSDKEEKFIKVSVTHNLALKVPFVNKIFGLFNTGFKPELPYIIRDLLALKIFDYDFSEITKVLLNEKFPYCTLTASAIMRLE